MDELCAVGEVGGQVEGLIVSCANAVVDEAVFDEVLQGEIVLCYYSSIGLGVMSESVVHEIDI